MKNKTPLTITENMKLRVSGRVMKVAEIQADGFCRMLHENGRVPARYSDRWRSVEFLQDFAKPADWKPTLTPRSELLLNI